MDLKGKLKQGMRIFGADDRDYGTIERFDDEYVYVGGRRVPMSAFDRMDNDRLYVGKSGAQYFSTEARGRDTGDTSVQVHEERLDVGKREVELGSVDIRKEVTSEQVSESVDLRRDEVHVSQVDVKDRRAAGDADLFKEGTIRVPVRGEEAVVSKGTYVTGEVVIDKEQTSERQTVSDTVRKERVTVDENYKRDRAELERHHTERRGKAGGKTRTFAEAEPNYRMGYETAHDERYTGKKFEDVEPEIRKSYESKATGSGDSWEHLREEIRGGWERARSR